MRKKCKVILTISEIVEYAGGEEYYKNTQKQRAMERGIRATKREIEAQKAVGGDTKELKAKLKKQTADYHAFSKEVGIRPKDNRLRVVSGSSDLSQIKKTSLQKSEKIIKVDFLIREHEKDINVIEERVCFEDAVKKVPSKVRNKIEGKIIIDIGKEGASQYDYLNDILYIAKGAKTKDNIHEIGHLVESKLMSPDEVRYIRKQIIGEVDIWDIETEVYYDAGGAPRNVFILKKDTLVSEY